MALQLIPRFFGDALVHRESSGGNFCWHLGTFNFVPNNSYQSNRGQEETTSAMSSLMFIVGLIIFALYMWGYIAMINQTHASQSRKAPDDLGRDEFSEG